jgi:2-polyprenyl-3-methyl-5-hydroxy-6-metoxy-1,4-benzoquinol methylase
MKRCPGCGGADCFSPFAVKGEYSYLRCATCHLLAIDPMPSEEQIAVHYAGNFQSGNYSTIRTFADPYRGIYRQYIRWMAGFVQLKGAHTLDVGCFTGDLVGLLLSEAQADAYGVELQEDAAAIAEKVAPGRVFRHNIDHPTASLAEASFDAITMMGLIEHVQTPGALLARARAMLKEGGWLFLQTPNASSWAARLSRTWWPPLAPVEHLHLFSEAAIRGALERSGFETREIRTHVKRLPVAYVYEMLRHFGPEWRTLLGPVYRLLPQRLREASAPFYAGEMLVAAQATSAPSTPSSRNDRATGM